MLAQKFLLFNNFWGFLCIRDSFMIEPVLFGPEQAKIWSSSQEKPGNKPNIADGAAKRRRYFASI